MGELRPRFVLRINTDPEEAMQHVSKRILDDKTVSGVRSNGYIFLKIPSWAQHYWSPEMSVRIEKQDYLDYTTVHCLIGPRQAVWAMYALIYAAIILATLFASMFGLVQYQSYGSSDWLWSIPAGIVIFSSVFIFAKLGQRKGRDEMLHLVSFLYHSLDEISEVKRIEG
jgi:hypothetical protein